MKKMNKRISVLLAAVMAGVLAAGCGGETVPTVDVPDLSNGYTYTKQSNDGLMQFYSPDAGLDAFINEYMERHLRYNENAIGDLKIGNGRTIWREWEAMSVMWMNTSGLGYSPKDSIGGWFSSVTQDAFGYIWMDNGNTVTDWGQSWQFPHMGHSGNRNSQEYYNTSYLNGTNDLAGDYFGSNALSKVWTGESNTGAVGTIGKGTTDFYDYMLVKGNDMRTVTFTYETPETSKTATPETKRNYPKPYMGVPYCSPFLEIDFSITDYDSLGSTDQIKDVEIWWKGGSGAKNDQWDSDHMVRYSEFSSNYQEQFYSSTHLVFPMYAHPNWGKSESVDDAVTDMKIVVQMKNGINAEVRLEEVTLAFDGRQVNNNTTYLAAAAYYFQYSQDTDWLAKNLTRMRSAMQFLLTYCHGDEDELITTEEFVGHDGSTNYDYLKTGGESPTNLGIGHGIGDGYWDAISSPQVSLYTNIYYYKALKAMRYLESMAAAAGITVPEQSSVMTANMKNSVTYAQTDETLAAKIEAFVPAFREYFWNEETGRFHMGYLADDDPALVAGRVDKVVDYGFTTFNQEAIELGLATDEQAKSITDWINGERTVEGDDADNSSSATQIYRFKFAPRWSTKNNEYMFWYRFDGKNGANYKWNKQVQNGGTSLQCTYYDVVAENSVNGADAAFGKMKNLQSWYEEVAAEGGKGQSFYKSYYTKRNIRLQGTDGAGVIGVDSEFLEAAVVPTVIPTVFFGLGSTELNTLNITPNLPGVENFDWWKMENLAYGDCVYDLTAGKDWVQINSISGNAESLKVKVTLPAPSGNFTVRQHNKVLVSGTDYTVQDGKVIINAPFVNGRIQIVAQAAAN